MDVGRSENNLVFLFVCGFVVKRERKEEKKEDLVVWTREDKIKY